MKTLIVSLIICIVFVPCAVAIFLILAFLAAFVPNLYFVFTCLAAAFATFATIWGPFWFLPCSEGSSPSSSGNQQHSISSQEKNHDKYFEGRLCS
jgi:hypothetical protein